MLPEISSCLVQITSGSCSYVINNKSGIIPTIHNITSISHVLISSPPFILFSFNLTFIMFELSIIICNNITSSDSYPALVISDTIPILNFHFCFQGNPLPLTYICLIRARWPNPAFIRSPMRLIKADNTIPDPKDL
jgi:hypothetical protein